MNIYEIISKIAEEAGALAPEQTGGVPFAFRGIDGTVAHLSPHLRKHGVVVVPKILDRVTTQREVGTKAITQTDLLAEFTFYAPDGSSVTATTAGLAQDFADRSAAQAQSVAFRVALLQTFFLPTHSKSPEEAGEDTQRAIAEEAAKTPAKSPAPPSPALVGLQAQVKAWLNDNEALDESSGELKALNGSELQAIAERLGAKKGDRSAWKNNEELLGKVVEAIKKGERK